MGLTNYGYVKRWRAQNKDKVNAQARRRYARKPELVAAIKKRYRERHGSALREKEAALARAKRKADPEGNKRRLAAFRARKKAEREAVAGRPKPSVCEICKEFHIRIVFDHCHATGSFRGWLCDRCNRVLGLVYDNPSVLRKQAKYLDQFNGKTDRKSKERSAQLSLCWATQEFSDSRSKSCTERSSEGVSIPPRTESEDTSESSQKVSFH